MAYVVRTIMVLPPKLVMAMAIESVIITIFDLIVDMKDKSISISII